MLCRREVRISPFASSLFSLHVCGVCLHEIATKRHRPQRGNCTLKSLRARIVRTYWWILAGVALLGPRATGVPQIEGRLLSGTGCWDVESVRLLERKLVFIFNSLPIPPSSNTLCHADFVWITQLEYIVMVIYFRRRDRTINTGNHWGNKRHPENWPRGMFWLRRQKKHRQT